MHFRSPPKRQQLDSDGSDSVDPKPVRHAPLSLWAIARMVIVELCQLFGEPQAIARAGAFTRETRALLLTWLRACETVVRHLLLIEAAAIVGELPRSRPSKQKHLRSRRPYIHDPDAPEAWRVSFHSFGRCFARRSKTASRRANAKAPQKRAEEWRESFVDPVAAAAARAEYKAWLARMRNSSPVSGGGDREAIGGGQSPHRLAALGTSPVNGGRVYSAWPLAERAEALLRVFNEPAPFARRLAYRLRRAPKRAGLLLHIPDDIDRALGRDTLTTLHDASATAALAFNSS